MKDAIAALGGAVRDQGTRTTNRVTRKTRKMSAVQRKAVGLRIKKYGAERREAKG